MGLHLVSVLLLTAPLFPQDPAAALQQLLENPALDGARVGVVVIDCGITDPGGGTPLLEHDGGKGFMTASNMKLITGATALLTLGPDHRFATRLESAGALRDGVLDGDLVLVGSGDPTFGGRHEQGGPLAVLERLVLELVVRHGIHEITGRVVGLDDVHGEEVMGKGWQWDYQSADYAAQLSGLCFAENVVTLELEGRGEGEQPALRVIPDVGYVVVGNEVLCGPEGGEAALRAERKRATNTIVVSGTLPAGTVESIKVSVENPTRFAAQALWTVLRNKGVKVRGGAIDADDVPNSKVGERKLLAKHMSPPLSEILVTLEKVSQNLFAEQLLRAAGLRGQERGDLTGGAAQAAAVLAGLGVDVRGLVVEDGSGLTRRNLVRPRQFAALLWAMWRSEHRDLFFSTLPVAGIEGTLEKRYPDGPARGRVLAKTGFISGVVALSGLVPRPEGEPLAFSILVNNFTCTTDEAKAAVDGFVQALAGSVGW